MLTHQQIADALGCSRQMAARHIERGCPRTSDDGALAWYHANIRSKSDRHRPRVPSRASVGPNYGSRILEAMNDAAACIELDGDILELPRLIATDPGFMPSITNNQAVRRHVQALRDKWFDVP